MIIRRERRDVPTGGEPTTRVCKGRAAGADWRIFYDWSLRKSENLRKEAGAGRADSGEPYRLTEGIKRRLKRRLNLIWPEPAKVKSDSAGADDGTA